MAVCFVLHQAPPVRFSISQRTARSSSGFPGSRRDERLHRERRGFDAGVGDVEQQRIVDRRPTTTDRPRVSRLRRSALRERRCRARPSRHRASAAAAPARMRSCARARPTARRAPRHARTSAAAVRDTTASPSRSPQRAAQHVRHVGLQIRHGARIVGVQPRERACAVLHAAFLCAIRRRAAPRSGP